MQLLDSFSAKTVPGQNYNVPRLPGRFSRCLSQLRGAYGIYGYVAWSNRHVIHSVIETSSRSVKLSVVQSDPISLRIMYLTCWGDRLEKPYLRRTKLDWDEIRQECSSKYASIDGGRFVI